jgi:CheY-like chemotaxis protein
MAHILIADDDVNIVEVMEMILVRAGHRVSKCSSGLEALTKLGIQPEDTTVELPDIVILDIMMPKSDGYTVGTLIRNRKRTQNLPILVITALQDMSPLFKETVPVQGMIVKPFRPEDLVEKVASILKGGRPA